MKLFLDDERNVSAVTWVELPLGQWTVVRSYDEFVDWITKNGLPTFISFDHDLADEHYPWHEHNKYDYAAGKISYAQYKEKTGMDAAKWLVEYCLDKKLPLPEFVAHTMNVVGKENIEALLNNFRKHQNDSD